VSEIGAVWTETYRAAIVTVRGKDWTDSEFAQGSKEVEGKNDITSADNTQSVVDIDTTSRPCPLSREKSSMTATTYSSATSEEKGDGADTQQESRNKPLCSHGIHTRVVSEHVLRTGDVVMCVTDSKQVEGLKINRDFLVVSTVGALPTPISPYSIVPVVVFVAMLILVATESIDMCPAALTVAAVFFMGGWITYEEIPRLIDLRLLMLMGCSLSFVTSMTKSGLAVSIAGGIASGSPSNFEALILMYAVTLVITELISNNAAAALMYPIAVALADQLGADFKPFAMGVLVASTAGFMSPVGYQCHVMVWGPGGYKFTDFILFGLLPDVLYWVVGCGLISALYPF
jgi:di/tricarboxylate transporter